MALLVEVQAFRPILRESKERPGVYEVEGIMQRAGAKNQNGRVYDKQILLREVDKYITEFVKNGNAYGELDHPDSQVINLKNVSHNISKLWWDGDNVMGSIELLPTPSGNILKALIGAGIKVGVSSRGMGSLKQVGEVLEVQDDFDLLGWDIVSTPSNPNSWMSPLHEGLSTPINPYHKVNSMITDILCANGSCQIF